MPLDPRPAAIAAAPMHLGTRPELCTGCLMCQIACSLEHEGSCAPRWARLKVTVDHAAQAFAIDVCRHCLDPACVQACTVGALEALGGGVSLDRELCSACGACVEACPYGAIFVDPHEQKALKCDLCGGRPRCAAYCETGAVHVVREGGGGTGALHTYTEDGPMVPGRPQPHRPKWATSSRERCGTVGMESGPPSAKPDPRPRAAARPVAVAERPDQHVPA